MDHVDRQNLITAIMTHIKKYDDEGRRCDLTAEETVNYANTLENFIIKIDEEGANDNV